MNTKWLHMVSWILVIVGALNWGILGITQLAGSYVNVVSMILGAWPQLELLVYTLVGVAGVYEIVTHKQNCKMCG